MIVFNFSKAPSRDWRPGDRIASIAVQEPTYKTGLGTVQRITLNQAIVVWDDGKQSIERLQDLIYAGTDNSKIVLKSDWYGDSYVGTDDKSLQRQIKSDLEQTSERVKVNQTLLAGLPLDTIGNLVKWR